MLTIIPEKGMCSELYIAPIIQLPSSMLEAVCEVWRQVLRSVKAFLALLYAIFLQCACLFGDSIA